MSGHRIEVHDGLPAAAQAIGAGLDADNAAAAPLTEVRALACLLHAADGTLAGGALGRTWGACAELQQLRVEPALRGAGYGGRLLAAFEQAAAARGCTVVFLETFSFQAPRFYLRAGYRERHRLAHYPHGIVRILMDKALSMSGTGPEDNTAACPATP